jgi:hypothetical protein
VEQKEILTYVSAEIKEDFLTSSKSLFGQTNLIGRLIIIVPLGSE